MAKDDEFQEFLPRESRYSGGKTDKGQIEVDGTTCKVFNKRIHHIPAGSVYIGRPSPWGNPFVIGKDGTREEVIQKFRDHLYSNPELMARVKNELVGKHLVCFCAPYPCHGRVLVELANEEVISGVLPKSTEWMSRAEVLRRHGLQIEIPIRDSWF